jgi:predicted CxxxxCH...CXXCH cytochrome family protein
MQPHYPTRLSQKLLACESAPLAPATRRGAFFWVILLSFASASCERSALSDGLPATQDCSTCHGSNVNAAPPKAVNGSSSTTDIGVGAHQAHLIAGKVAGPVACNECHRVPTDLLTHPDPLGRPAAVIFGSKARLHRAAPVWDRASASCAHTYCHGAMLSGAADRPSPIWTQVNGKQLGCNFCHGYPPAGNHPNSEDCNACHGDVVNSDGTIKNLNLHIDGEVQFYVPAPDAGAAGAANTGGVGNTNGAGSGAGGSSP